MDLLDAILELKDRDEARRFINDLCTPQEIRAMRERWNVAKLLFAEDLSYRNIRKATGASLTTIGRVSRFLKDENNYGYKLLLDRLKVKEVIK